MRCAHMCLITKDAKNAVCRCATDFTLVNDHECVQEGLQIPNFRTLPPLNTSMEDVSTTTLRHYDYEKIETSTLEIETTTNVFETNVTMNSIQLLNDSLHIFQDDVN